MLSKVHQYIQNGWPSQAEDDLKPYWSRRLELSSLNGYVLWGSRIVIPSPGQESLLIELHGTTGMAPAELLMGRKLRSRLDRLDLLLNSGFKISKADNSLITTSVRRPIHLWRDCSVIIFYLPPHTTHEAQPLDN